MGRDLLTASMNNINLGSEQNAADLQKKILAKVGTITDIVATIGGFAWKSTLLQQSVEELRKVCKK